MDELGCLPGLPPGGMRKHRTRQRAMRAAFMLFSLLHLTIGAFLVYEKCFLGWHVIGFTFFGILLLRERTISTKGSILGGQQFLLALVTIHALWHFNEQSPSPVIGAHREGHRLRLDRRGAHIANNAIPPSGGGKVGLANTLTAGGAPSTSGRRSIGGGDALLEWPDVPKSASRRGLGSGPPPVDPAKSMGTRLDLANPTSDEVYRSHHQLFDDLPVNGFSSHFKNPCWLRSEPRRGSSIAHEGRNLLSMVENEEEEEEEGALGHENSTWPDETISDTSAGGGGRLLLASSLRSRLNRGGITDGGRGRPPPEPPQEPPPPSGHGDNELECLPYAYVLGMPKCGSSDLWERLSKHANVQRADRKETRFFTRGEFSGSAPHEGFLPPSLPLRDFTTHHRTGAAHMYQEWLDHAGVDEDYVAPSIVVEGGPHTLWWSMQDPDGTDPSGVKKADSFSVIKPAPIPVLVHSLQPHAKLIVTLAEPVRRMYSDYFFLTANSVATDSENHSPELFHAMAAQQEAAMRACLAQQAHVSPADLAYEEGKYAQAALDLAPEAVQACAYDRYHFGRPGTGRIAIGVYWAFLHRWLQMYPRHQLLALRLEDFNHDPKQHLSSAFDFLGLSAPSEDQWSEILVDRTFNEHRAARGDILPETQALLKAFYAPFNTRLVELLKPGGARGLMLEEQSKEHGGKAQVESENEASGDEGAGRFTWEDVWLTHSADRPVMKSAWNQGGGGSSERDNRHLSAAELHDPRGIGMHQDYRRPEEIEADVVEKHRHLEEDDKTHGEGGEGPVWHEGRDGLPNMPTEMIVKDQGATALCLAAMGLHVEALNQFLQTEGVVASSHMPRDAGRTALHCAGSVWIYGDSLRESYIFSLLQSTSHWLEKVMDPAPPANLSAYGMYDMTHGARGVVKLVVKTLLDAGADPNAKDDDGRTPLHYAALGGLESMANELLKAGADPNIIDDVYLQTPLHLSATHGHADIAAMMMAKRADAHLKDVWGNSFIDVATAFGGAISAAALKEHLNLEKVAQRVLPPEAASASLVHHGLGGWSNESLSPPYAWPEEDILRSTVKVSNAVSGATWPKERCDVDILDAKNVTAEEVFRRYLMMNRPVLLRGLNDNSPAWKAYERNVLKEAHGEISVHVSDIPYNQKFGSPNGRDESLGTYIDEIANHRLGDHPWYVFKGHPVPRQSSAAHSLVPIATVPIPKLMFDIFEPMASRDRPRGANIAQSLMSKFFPSISSFTGASDKNLSEYDLDPKTQESWRRPFVNMQWALGTKGSGAPVHFHNTAWNQLFYGKKHWYLLPPGRNLMGKKQVFKWVEEDVTGLKAQGYEFSECMQQQGDVLIVPELWGHAVLNTQDSIAVASEVKGSNYRLKLPRAYHDLSRNMGLDAGIVEGGADPAHRRPRHPPLQLDELKQGGTARRPASGGSKSEEAKAEENRRLLRRSAPSARPRPAVDMGEEVQGGLHHSIAERHQQRMRDSIKRRVREEK